MPIRTPAFFDIFPLWLLCLASFALGAFVIYLMARKCLIQAVPLARQAVIDGILDPVIVLDSHNTLIAVNRAAEQVLGLDASAIGQTAECLPPVCAALLRHHGGDEIWRQEIALTGETGRRLFALTLASFHQDEHDGRVLIGRDVTEERRLQASLAANERRFRGIFERANTGIVFCDAEGRVIDCNQAFARMLGYATEDLIGMHFGRFTHPDDLIGERVLIEDLRTGKRNDYRLEKRYVRRSGDMVWADIAVTTLRDIQGRTVNFVGVAVDISDRKRVERILRDSEARLSYLMAASPVIVYTCDPNPPFKTTYISPNVQALMGFAPENFVANENFWAERVYPGDQPALAEGVTPLFLAGRHAFEYRFRAADNRYRWLCDEVCLMRDDLGQPLELVGYWQDVTERKRAEQRERNRRLVLEQLTHGAALGDVLRTIVTGIEDDDPAMVCSILLLDQAEGRLLHGAAVSLPAFFNQIVHGLAIGPKVGCCGAAAYTGERVVAEDIANHPNWVPYTGIMQQAGLASCWSEPIRGAANQILGTFAIYHRDCRAPTTVDIALIEDAAKLAAIAIEQYQAGERLRLAASVFEHAREAIMVTSPTGDILEVNTMFTRITGYPREEALGKNPRLFGSGRQGPEFFAGMWRDLAEKGHWYGEIWNRRKDGQVYAALMTISAVRDAENHIHRYVALFSDITRIKAHEQALERIAHYDALTGLPNRLLLADRLHQAMVQSERRGLRLAVAYLDLDGFKAINDIHGHMVGDQLLIAVTRRLVHALREGDTLARLGGDEFVAVLLDLPDTHACLPILSRLLNAASRPVRVEGLELRVSASIGVSFYPQDEDIEGEPLLRQADQAMYRAKLAGKNRYHLFEAEQDRSLRGHYEHSERVRRALAGSEFELYYQPRVNLRTGAVVGVEALVRWRHPELGLLPPSEFLSVVEDHGVGVALDSWVIVTALAQLAAWREAGLTLRVSVNIGARQLRRHDVLTRLREFLAAHPGLPSGSLELEILESSALEDMERVAAVMRAGRELGVRFALDDFGTGYSSLTYLKRLPAEAIKIDHRFVGNMLDDPEDLAIVEAVIGLAGTFRREVVAEGVETLAHGRKLLALGCELAQGYGIARPMPAAELPGWVADWRANPALDSPVQVANRQAIIETGVHA